MITESDREFMRIALDEAIEGYMRGDFPVGAVLTIDNKIIGKGSNSTRTNGEWVSHAESSLIRAFAPAIQKGKNEEKKIEIYTTLSPCLMCLGTSVLNRVGRIVYACRDPNGGAEGLNPKELGDWYSRKWPTIEQDLNSREESYVLLRNHMQKFESWNKVLQVFEEMYKTW